jgi:hypothetical protein
VKRVIWPSDFLPWASGADRWVVTAAMLDSWHPAGQLAYPLATRQLHDVATAVPELLAMGTPTTTKLARRLAERATTI